MRQMMRHNLEFMVGSNEGRSAQTPNVHVSWKRHDCSWRVTHIYKMIGKDLEHQSTEDQQPVIARKGDNERRRELGLMKELAS